MSASPIDPQKVLEALRTVKDPELHVDVVTLGMIEGLVVDGGKVSFTVNLTTPGCPLKAQIEKDVRTALMALPGVESVDLRMGAKVRKSIEPQGDLIPEVANTVAVGSGKGGVGKSTVAVNLALSFARAGASVGLMDADVYGPNLVQMMGVKTKPEMEGKKILPVPASGLKLMSMAFFLKEDQPVVWRGPMLHGAMKQFLGDVAWGRLDYLFIDMPPGTGDVQLTLSQIIPLTGAVLVTTPQDVALSDVRKAAAMFRQVNVPILGVVENMSYFNCPHCGERAEIFSHGGGRRVAEGFGTTLLGEVPLDIRVRQGGDDGLPPVIHDPKSGPALIFKEIAEKLAAIISVNTYKRYEQELAAGS
ncbi:MAG TPA: Mrp/NBP35 family ATP-binding protein [Candidatus Polarisedimenticolia bacterium]|nr:Mrp/NBP35 family ATP-binding protein [Candidatus Polarisedimenticolia bacterium]